MSPGEAAARRAAAWRFLRAVVGSQAGGVAAAALSGLAWQIGAVAAPLGVARAIDHGILKDDHKTLLLWLLVLLAAGLLEGLAGASRHVFAIRNPARGDARVRDAIFAHALRLDASYHDRVGPGGLMSRASSGSGMIARLLDAVGHTIGYVLTVFAVAGVLLTIDVDLALVVLLPLPLVSAAGWAYSKRYHERTTRLQEELARSATLAEETISGIRVVKGLGAGPALRMRFGEQSDRIVQRGLSVARVDAVFVPALELLPLLGLLAVLWLGGRRVIAGGLGPRAFRALHPHLGVVGGAPRDPRPPAPAPQGGR